MRSESWRWQLVKGLCFSVKKNTGVWNAALSAESGGELVKFGGGGRRSEIVHARKTTGDAGRTLTARPLLKTRQQVRRCRDDSIEGIVLELGSLYNMHWSNEPSVLAATAKEKLGIGRALRNR